VPDVEAVFFDVDGTLVDTNYLHTAAWWHALSDFGIAATMAQVHRLIGRSGEDLLTELAGGRTSGSAGPTANTSRDRAT
jgi:beta-phosphoglucomutase-like phosphatase (HAD superfamily)